MRSIKLILIFMVMCICNGYTQENEFKQLLSMQFLSTNDIPNICSEEISLSEPCSSDGLSSLLLNGETKELQNLFESGMQCNAKSSKKSQKFETYSVVITNIDGYIFHVANYYGSYGNSRVITCLNGEMRGLQGISDNGVQMAESTDVVWHNDYFVHRYPRGKVISYSNRQILEFK